MKRSNVHVTKHRKRNNAEETFEEIRVGILYLNSCIQGGV